MRWRLGWLLLGMTMLLSGCPHVGTGPGGSQIVADWPKLGAAPNVAAEGSRDAAVIIGIESYLVVPGVPGAGANAKDWYSFFIDGLRIPVDHVHWVRDRQAVREEILKQVAAAAGELGAGGKIWFVFIAHGAPSKDGKDGMLVGADAQQTADSLYARSVGTSEIVQAIDKAPVAVAIIDACFSGQTSSGKAIASGLQPLVVMRDTASLGKVTMLSAGASDQFAGPLPGSNRPAFSYLVLGALRGWAADGEGNVTAQAAIDYAKKALDVLPTGRTQTPSIAGADPAMVLVHQAREAGPVLSDAVKSETAVAGDDALAADPDVPDVSKLDVPRGLDADSSSVELFAAATRSEHDAEASACDRVAAWERLAARASVLNAESVLKFAGARREQWFKVATAARKRQEAMVIACAAGKSDEHCPKRGWSLTPINPDQCPTVGWTSSGFKGSLK